MVAAIVQIELGSREVIILGNSRERRKQDYCSLGTMAYSASLGLHEGDLSGLAEATVKF
jgi:hypothetical protein